MLTTQERIQLRSELTNLEGLSYGQIAAILSKKFKRKISRHTVRHYLGLMHDYKGLTKGRPSGSTREGDVWNQLLPELLTLTGLSASGLYRALTQLMKPGQLPFGESAFHERTGLRTNVKTTGNNRVRGRRLLDRCNLRVKVIAVSQKDVKGTRVYIAGYEELTSYLAFDVISLTAPGERRILLFVKAIEDHLGLPICRVSLIGKEFSVFAETKSLEDVAIEYIEVGDITNRIVSPYERTAEIDLLQRYVKKQNDNIAREKASIAKKVILQFVQQDRSRDGIWESEAKRKRMQKLQEKSVAEAAMLEPFLTKRFRLYRPRRRPIYPDGNEPAPRSPV